MNGGLPLKEKKMLNQKTMASEKSVRDMIARSLQKEFGGTKSSVDFIKKILDDAYAQGMSFDVTDLRGPVMAFAANSSNQKLQALQVVTKMKWKSDDMANSLVDAPEGSVLPDEEAKDPLLVICWMFEDSDIVNVMINPTPQEIEAFLRLKLVGFFNRRYDNHIVYAAYLGYSIEMLYKLSQKIVKDHDPNAMFGEAYGISHADIWEFASIKMSLKKWQIELGLPHVENDIPWDQPVPEDKIEQVVEYCKNDVRSTKAVFLDRKQDYVARQILADLSGLTINDTTQRHTARIIFGKDRNPQASFVYTELKEQFPGYTFDQMRSPASDYKGINPGEGGYVYSEPGMYENVEVWDVASMHPTSIVQLNAFGQYTPRFKDLLDARIAIKRRNYSEARQMLDGKLAPYLEDPKDAKQLSYALKIVINIVYGLTSAKFDNPFRDLKNRDNIVAKRGALFMIDLHEELRELGAKVVHIKTDSVKVVNPTDEIRDFIVKFGEKYGYEFEHEGTYSKFALLNDAVFIAKYGWAEDEELIGTWEAKGAQFLQPYVFKTLFSGDPIVFEDFGQAKSVQTGAIYLNFDHDVAEVPPKEGMKFIGKTGLFVPVAEGQGGGMLYRSNDKDEKLHKVAGTSGHLWMELDVAKKLDVDIDVSYFTKLADSAVADLSKFGDVEAFCERRLVV
jgi:hypothetical protein